MVDQCRSDAPAVVVFRYRLRSARSWVEKLYLWASVLITPSLVGLPGFGSTLWLAYDESALYGGVYEWDGAGRAESSAQTLRWILAVISAPGSVAYHLIPNKTRDQYLAESEDLVSAVTPDSDKWRCA